MAGTGGAYDRGRPSSGNLFAHCAAQLLAVHLVRQYTSSTVGRSGARAACPAPAGLSERQIQQVLAFIRTQLGEQLSLAVLAQQIGYSSYHFARLLRRTLGASPHQVVLRLRLRACAAAARSDHAASGAHGGGEWHRQSALPDARRYMRAGRAPPCPAPVGGNAPTEDDVNKNGRKDKICAGSPRYPASTRVQRHLLTARMVRTLVPLCDRGGTPNWRSTAPGLA